ncbi:DUF5793 family protein [Natronorarus salvus]|uniref:DUF5793 family protein n=1 Tax=Natronorarus salvus TaxID=3117733 RepID=UPI002F2609A4
MRREQFTLDVRGIDWVEHDGDPETPTVTIEFDGPGELLDERLVGPDGDLLNARGTDVAFRLRSEESGVVSVTDRLTGDFVFELNADAEDVFRFVRAARAYGEESGVDDGKFRVHLLVDGEELVTYEKSTFLVYDSEGTLLRERSLIPSGVEL